MMLCDLLDLASPKATYALLYLLRVDQHLHWAFFPLSKFELFFFL